jgi:AbrB family looped-hinge helix DNA binding protein
MRATVPIRSNGRLVIPSPIRRELNLNNGDLVEINVQPVEEVNAGD